MIKFEAGKTYNGRFIGDADAVIFLTVAKRTAKFITTADGKRLGVSEYDGSEYVMPFGRYSMAPVISAARATA